MADINIFQDEEGGFCLTVMDADDRTAELFEERELQGGGYTWLAIVSALIEMHAPECLPRLWELDAEADNMYAYCEDRDVLEKIAGLIQAAVKDHRLFVAAMEHAGEDLE